MRFSRNKEIDKTARALVRDCKWSFKKRGGHVCVYQPETGTLLAIPGSPSCPRACANWHSQLRRMIRSAGGSMPEMRGFA